MAWDELIEFAGGKSGNTLEVVLDEEEDGHKLIIFIKGELYPDEGEFSHLQIGSRTFDLNFETIKGGTNRSLSIAEAKQLRDAIDKAIAKAESAP